jgi:hypothetical protein
MIYANVQVIDMCRTARSRMIVCMAEAMGEKTLGQARAGCLLNFRRRIWKVSLAHLYMERRMRYSTEANPVAEVEMDNAVVTYSVHLR